MKRISMVHRFLALALAAVLSLGSLAFPADAAGVHVGDVITFGTYEQNNNRWDGPEDLAWIVLRKEADRVLVITRYCIDCIPYHSRLESVTWEYSAMRRWLNEDFFDIAFTSAEQAKILTVRNENPEHPRYQTSSGRATEDKVFLLSLTEAEEYFTTNQSRMAAPTAYARARGAYRNADTQQGWWWLRTTSYFTDHVTYVASAGGVSYDGREVIRQDAGVRPAMWMSLSAIS